MERTAARTVIATLLSLGLTALPAGASAERRSGRHDDRALAATRVRVRIVDNTFRPRTVTVSRGTRVRWVNRGDNVHSVKASKGPWGSDLLEPGDRYRRVFRKAGTFAYYCTVHPTMKGTIVVT
ncbi:MAG TPA: cupredoxin domain-containing protein [Actinomycetota bacterium]